jgi:hypothetical protein
MHAPTTHERHMLNQDSASFLTTKMLTSNSIPVEKKKKKKKKKGIPSALVLS